MKIVTRVKGVKPRVIGILGFDGVNVLDLAGPLETFAAARAHETESDWSGSYEIRIIGVSARSFASDSGVVFKAEDVLSKVASLDTLIIPGGPGIRTGAANRNVIDWLAGRASQIRRIVSVSTGIYAVAGSGLLDGRTVTTHWRFAQDVSRRFPTLRLDSTCSFTRDGPFYTCGGGNAAIEMTLALIEEDFGSRLALSLARELVMRLRPPGDHQDPLDPSQFECGPIDRLADLPAWITAHLGENLSVEALADRTCLCPRHFGRVFRSTFNSTPAAFVERVRLNEARRLLLVPRNRVENVAQAVGFTNPASFRRAFQRCYGISPTGYQRYSRHRGPDATPFAPGNRSAVHYRHKTATAA